MSLSTAETTSISKCVDKATSVKKKRYRSKSRPPSGHFQQQTGVHQSMYGRVYDTTGGGGAENNNRSGGVAQAGYSSISRPKSECRSALMEMQMPRFDEDTSQFDLYLRKVSRIR